MQLVQETGSLSDNSKRDFAADRTDSAIASFFEIPVDHPIRSAALLATFSEIQATTSYEDFTDLLQCLLKAMVRV